MTRVSHSSADASSANGTPIEPEPRAAGNGRRQLQANWEIPIIDAKRRIAGWTKLAPEYRGAMLFHAEAERLVGGTVLCAYVQIEDQHDASRAGAPAGWQGTWRCLALCSEKALSPKLERDLPTIELGQQA
jgi:hypothetical protein